MTDADDHALPAVRGRRRRSLVSVEGVRLQGSASLHGRSGLREPRRDAARRRQDLPRRPGRPVPQPEEARQRDGRHLRHRRRRRRPLRAGESGGRRDPRGADRPGVRRAPLHRGRPRGALLVLRPADPRGGAGRVGRGSDRTLKAEAAYFVCASPRAGTSLLTGLLKSTGIAGPPEEYFWRDMPDWSRRWAVSRFEDYLQAALREGTTANGVFGAKLMWDYLGDFVSRSAPSRDSDALPFPSQLLTRKRRRISLGSSSMEPAGLEPATFRVPL